MQCIEMHRKCSIYFLNITFECIERGVILCILIWINTFEWVWRSPATTYALTHFLPLFMFASSLWIRSTVFDAVYTYFLVQSWVIALCIYLSIHPFIHDVVCSNRVDVRPHTHFPFRTHFVPTQGRGSKALWDTWNSMPQPHCCHSVRE